MIVYTEAERSAFVARHPRIPVHVASNAVYSAAELVPAHSEEPRDCFIIIGRLVEGKRPDIAVQAFMRFATDFPEARLLVIGDGPMARELRDSAVSCPQILFLGEVTDQAELRKVFARSVALVAAGYVGLNVTQALGFGVPVIYAKDEPHAPEVEALHDGNAWRFSARDSVDLARVMRVAWAARDSVDENAEKISAEVRAHYSTESMGQAFIDILGAVK
ncbi:glycosyltransferase [Microbacterium plantarum]|uniref:Glycosyltransferase n=1 Tax=Microbacterium plantarum TaxID=1816425 RepID=A0ABV5EVX6_9MICO